MTEASLDDAITGVVDAFARIGLHRHWRSGSSASADGTNWDVTPESMKSSYHIRYGGYGGIGSYLVSDTYIALFSRVLACGAYEGHAILDFFFFSSRRRHTRSLRDWSSDVCSSD